MFISYKISLYLAKISESREQIDHKIFWRAKKQNLENH